MLMTLEELDTGPINPIWQLSVDRLKLYINETRCELNRTIPSWVLAMYMAPIGPFC